MKKAIWLAWVAAIGLSLCLQSNAQTVINGSFEVPVLSSNSFAYDPSGGTWLFAANAGIINAPGGAFFGPAAPDGSQYAFLQSAGAPGAFSQSINFTLAGTYQLSYLVAGRSNNGAGAAGDLSYQILLDSTIIATDATTTGQAFTSRGFQFTAGAGNHTLTFEVSPGATGDNSAFFDTVSIQVPEPGTALLLLTFAPVLPIVGAIRRRNQ